jgi:hypothetical protein
LVVTAVLFEDNEEADRCEDAIKHLRARLKLHRRFEFRFNSCSSDFREQFLSSVAGSQFFYCSLVLNKAELSRQGLTSKDSLYEYATGLVFETAKPHLTEAKVVLDRYGNREFRDRLGSYLKLKMNDKGRAGKLIREVKMEASHSSNLLQLADMVCGAVARSYNVQRAERWKFRSLISHKELRVQVWPNPRE